MRVLHSIVIGVCTACLWLAPAAAEVERIEVIRSEAFAYGESFGETGPYRKIVGRIWFALDPDAAANEAIVDLRDAERGEDGLVRFSSDFYALRPFDSKKGNGTLLVEVSNRGGKAMVRYFNRGAARTFDPSTIEDAGDGFLMRQGYTLVWIGWQFDVPPRPELLRLDPVYSTKSHPGMVRADHVFAEPSKNFALGHRDHLAYPVSNPSDPRNRLMVRDSRLGKRTVIRRDRWVFGREIEAEADEGSKVVADPRHVHYPDGFEPGKIYEVVYVADRPAIVGLGMAAFRDAVSYMKHDPNSPVGGQRAIGLGISQTGRFLRMFLYQGFNADLEGRPVFDGVWAHTAGAGRGSFNHRFGQPSRDAHAYSAFFYPTDLFPFTGMTQRDPETGRADGLLKRLSATAASPKIFFTNTGYEYWGRAASLIHTDVAGTGDATLLPNVRIYHFASTQHFVGPFPPRKTATRYDGNPANFFWHLRALLVGMDDWISAGTAPPPSRYPRIADGSLVAPQRLDWPHIRGVEPPERPHEAYRVNYGRGFADRGIVDIEPPRLGRAFPVRVSAIDEDGNEIAGIRSPEIAVPLATYTPWNFRAAEIGAPDEMADFRGSFFPFRRTRLERLSDRDPRRAVGERYSGREDYLERYTQAAQTLVEQRYLLDEDIAEMIEHANRLWDLVAGSDAEGTQPR